MRFKSVAVLYLHINSSFVCYLFVCFNRFKFAKARSLFLRTMRSTVITARCGFSRDTTDIEMSSGC